MRVAAIYDVHGNLPALEAVLDDIAHVGVDRIVIGGDVLPGPLPREALDRLLTLEVPRQFIHGNGDREVLARLKGVDTPWFLHAEPGRRALMQWTAEQLDGEHAQALASWPSTIHFDIDGLGDVLFCHATPVNDTDIFTRETPEDRLLPVFAQVESSVVVCGHTHMQFDRVVGGTRVVNAGSVGMPFQSAGAYWLLLGPRIEFRRTSYDLAAAADRIRATTYPQAKEFADRNVLNPPSETETLEVFTAMSLMSAIAHGRSG